jgi:hypothetical protein
VGPRAIAVREAVTIQVAAANNRLLALAFGNGPRTPTNALLDLPGGRTGLTGTPTRSAPDGTTQSTSWVRRQAPGQVFVPFVVTDRCRAWQTFVGAGTGIIGC